MGINNKIKVAVLGAGSMGTALSACIAKNGYDVNLWVRRKSLCDKILKLRENPEYHPRIKLPLSVQPINDYEQCVNDADIIFFSVPSHAMRDVAKLVSPFVSKNKIILHSSKGIEYPPPKRMSEVLFEELCIDKICVMSGPNFATELIKEVPSITMIASKDVDALRLIKKILESNYLIVESTDDIVGVEIGGIMKGIISISIGLVDALGLGDNVRGVLFTEGIFEMKKICLSLGGKPETILGPAGIGDLATTAFSLKSRNRTIGFMLGLGLKSKIANTIVHDGIVIEGAKSVKAIREIAKYKRIDIPLVNSIYKIFYEKETLSDVLSELWKELKYLTH